jgi:hypothetical protein
MQKELCFVIILLSMIVTGNVSADDAWVEKKLPVFPPGIVVMDGNGNVLNPHAMPVLEFKELTLMLKVEPDSFSGYEVSKTICEAIFDVETMLPPRFYNSLIKNYSELKSAGEIVSDPAVNERVIDLALFLGEIWSLNDKNGAFVELNGRDSVGNFISLLDFHYNCAEEQGIIQNRGAPNGWH